MSKPAMVLRYGGGVNSVAAILTLYARGERPDAIVMADPGSEWPETIAYRDDVVRPWLAANGWPDVTVVSRKTGLPLRKGRGGPAPETLYDECARTRSLPSIAYGWKKCSQKFKAEPAIWWTERQDFARTTWANGRRVVIAIGYDAGEPRRARAEFGEPSEAKRYVPRYPLIEAGYDRDDCVELIRAAALPIPHKSACTFCPSNSMDEWNELRDRHPSRFEDAVQMSRVAAETITTPDVAGLMRCRPHGKRQLHVWADDGCPDVARATESELPCECAL